MSTEGMILRILRGITTDKSVVGEERLATAVLYVGIGLGLLWIGAVLARVPLGRLPVNPLRWHWHVWNEAATTTPNRFYPVILLCITSVCYLAAPLVFWLQYLFFSG